jgi:hypothetical protein
MFDFITKHFKASSPYSSIAKDIFTAYNRVRPDGAKDLICYVPFNSLTFSWLGKVYACTYNRNILVGEYPKDSIRDIWFGEATQKNAGIFGAQRFELWLSALQLLCSKAKIYRIETAEFRQIFRLQNTHLPACNGI